MKIMKHDNMMDKSEKLFILLSILGLFPFIIGLLDLLINKNNLFFLVNLPKYYGSIIFTFLGAIYWGAMLNLTPKNFIPEKIKLFIIIWSVFPSILGVIVLSINNNFSLLMLSMGFFLCQLADEIFDKYLSFPNWYLPLRRILTLIVVIVLICSYFIIQTS
tara:strand:- start:173 stop:655 length:483 start_codon:yes stop_codon:yes gene_type:complete